MDINDHIDHQRWLIDNGFINDLHKDNLYVYGTIVHRDVKAVELHIDAANKLVNYEIFVDARLAKQIERFKKLSASSGLFDLWMLRRILRKEGNLNFNTVLTNFVKTYLGPKWNVGVAVKDIRAYEEGYAQQNNENNRQPDPG